MLHTARLPFTVFSSRVGSPSASPRLRLGSRLLSRSLTMAMLSTSYRTFPRSCTPRPVAKPISTFSAILRTSNKTASRALFAKSIARSQVESLDIRLSTRLDEWARRELSPPERVHDPAATRGSLPALEGDPDRARLSRRGSLLNDPLALKCEDCHLQWGPTSDTLSGPEVLHVESVHCPWLYSVGLLRSIARPHN